VRCGRDGQFPATNCLRFIQLKKKIVEPSWCLAKVRNSKVYIFSFTTKFWGYHVRIVAMILSKEDQIWSLSQM